MITIYKLNDNAKYTKFDTWNDGKFEGPLSSLDLKKEEEVKRRFNTSYYRTAGEEKKSESKFETTEKIEINLREL